MYFKVVFVCCFAFSSAKAGFLNIGPNVGNLGNNGHPNGDASGGSFGFQQQVPLTLTPGPIPQSSAAPAPHAAAVISTSFSAPTSQQSPQSYPSGPAATSSSYRQQHVNSVPATITTHGVATSFVAVPSHGFFGNNAGGNANSNANAGSSGSNNGLNNNGLNNGGSSAGSYGYGGYGYSFSSAGGNAGGNSGNSQGNNAGGYLFGYSGNGASGNNNGFSG
ncbi:hypothetical protein PPYR_12202 [Photinus pyralis]|uniref:Uncharacterized protein n=2 Tax=Photinus pyralis TaxID=7054 RepID=A0A5N3ZZH8_PHOPY|nr:glycine, alanine and asparagine-rich protein-like [Photinus pyralis]KAB0790449.1 hypothetical protein PPYR_15138 [Photinus pyralis]KAB0795363.1 hypothetical protein PPYR_12202 [Photinus pyralis]